MSGYPGERKYSDAQREALLRSVMVGGVSIAETRRRAESGALGVPAFRIPYSTALDIVRHNRAAYAQRNPDAMRAEIDRDLLELAALARREAQRLKDQARDGKDVNADDIRRAVQALKVAQGAVAAAPARGTGAPHPNGTTAQNNPHQQDASIYGRLGLNAPNGTPPSTEH